MWVGPNDYRALYACMENGAVGAAKLLLDSGMDLEQYKEWAKRQSHGLRCDGTLASLEEHWAELQAREMKQEQAAAPEMGGGITLG